MINSMALSKEWIFWKLQMMIIFARCIRFQISKSVGKLSSRRIQRFLNREKRIQRASITIVYNYSTLHSLVLHSVSTTPTLGDHNFRCMTNLYILFWVILKLSTRSFHRRHSQFTFPRPWIVMIVSWRRLSQPSMVRGFLHSVSTNKSMFNEFAL